MQIIQAARYYTKRILSYLLGIYLFILCSMSFAQTIIINGKTIIDKDTTYTNVDLDMNHGSFFVTNNATLKLVNTHVVGTIAPYNPVLIHVSSGQLILNNNHFEMTATNIPPNPDVILLYHTIKVDQGVINVFGNWFKVDKPLRVNLIYTTGNYPLSNFKITHNKIFDFHGAIFLTNTNHALVAHNFFSKISLSNIFNINCHYNTYTDNTILFPYNDAIDIIDSDHINISRNYISLTTCYSVLILRGKQILLTYNKVIGAITYAVFVNTDISLSDDYPKVLLSLINRGSPTSNQYPNTDIRIENNYFSQNRYGVTTKYLNGLIVKNNIFIQKFQSNEERQFWTNNVILLTNTSNITWENNLYKEAYTQSISENNQKSSMFVNFPATGGVVL